MIVTATASRVIPAAPDKVWTTLTSKQGMKAYMMGADVETDWKVGRPIVMSGEQGGKHFEDSGEVRSFEPGHSFSYTHQSGGKGPVHVVTVELEAEDANTSKVTITQSNDDGRITEADRRQQADYEKAWAMMLEGVEKAVAN